MDKDQAKELAREVNLLIDKYRGKRVKIPDELMTHVNQVVRNLSFGHHADKDVEEAKMFMDHLTKFYDRNRDFYESAENPAAVESPENSDQKSPIIT